PETVTEHLELPYHNKVRRRKKPQPSGFFFASHVDLQIPGMCASYQLCSLFTGEDDTWKI
ncbi:unnamed protein product, partial [Brassica oleracea]